MENIGAKVKALRLENKMTLKDLGKLSKLSIGFLSQFERDQTTIAIDSLSRIAKIFDVDITYFIGSKPKSSSPIVRKYDNADVQILSSNFISRVLINDVEASFLPRIIEILPNYESDIEVDMISHEGEEFIYVLEGILDLIVDGVTQSLYPGDAAYISSKQQHNWLNNTNRTIKLLTINYPNAFKHKEDSSID